MNTSSSKDETLQSRLQALRPELMAFARSRTRSLSEAEDVVQLSLLRALEKMDTLNDSSKLRAWVYTIARRVLIDSSRMARREVLSDPDLSPGLSCRSTDLLAGQLHPCACAVDLTNSLAPGQAELIRLVDLEEFSLEEVAAQLLSTKNAATVRLHRARQNLKDKLREHCGVIDASSARRCSCDEERCEKGPD